MAFGQFGVVVDPAKVDVACPDEECHVAPVFMGEGGFVGELADGFDMANFVVTCGNTTASGSAAGDGGGVVRQLFSMANGLACHAEGGSIQIHGLADGGWYWINDDMNSAVSPLIAKDALMGDEVMPTDPGGVTLMASDYGTYVKSGDRVGILPHFVPTAPADPPPPVVEPEAPTVCMPTLAANGRSYYANSNDCMLGDGRTTIVMTSMTSDGRSQREVTSVHRNPSGGSDIEIALDLWSNGSGHISGVDNPHLGWNRPIPQWWFTHQPEPFKADFEASLDGDDALGTNLANAGITLNPGERIRIPGKPGIEPALTTGNDPITPAREDGFHMDSPTNEPQCIQNIHTIEDGGGSETHYLQFSAASGTDPVNILITGTVADGNVAGLQNDASLTDLAAWAVTHNSTPTNARIRTVAVRAGAGPDENPETTADNTDIFVPAVVCKPKPAPDSEATYRYSGATLSISPTTTFCNRSNNRTAVVEVEAKNAKAMNDKTTPAIAETSATSVNPYLNAVATLQVHCPAG